MFMSISIPVWGIILAVVVYLTPIIWALITMYFTQKETKNIINAIGLKIEAQDKLIRFVDSKFDTKHDKLENDLIHKIDKVKDNIQSSLLEISKTVNETKGVVNLIVLNRLKTD